MARKTLGFVPLIWECAYCKAQNPGPIKTCTKCGAPQPKDVEFLQVDEEQFNFIKDEALIRMAKAGPDIHCPYCGTRNANTAELCSNCGGDLSQGGKAREAGNKVRTIAEANAQPPVPSAPPSQPAQPQPGSRGRSALIVILAIVAVIVCVVIAFFVLGKTETESATVTGVEWERSIAIEAFIQTAQSAFWDEIPEGAEIQTCTQTYRYTSDQPEPNSTEVCGETRVEDTGTGIGEVVQDCTYDVYAEFCDYTMMQWVPVDRRTEFGENLNPAWPALQLTTDQREGERTEDYKIFFSGEGDTYTYTTTDLDLFLLAEPGSQWTLEVTNAGNIRSLNPSN